ncbi:MAG: hypothetical protein Q4F00_13270 [bacterium]|nr:hypothetical protein [bacterium]
MNIQSAGSIAYTSSVYSYAGRSDCGAAGSLGTDTNDSADIGIFNGGGSEGHSLEELQSQKAQAESERSELQGQADEAQSQINARKGEIAQEQLGDEASGELQAEYQEAQAEFDEASAAKNEAQQELTQLSQESSANDQAINANAQQKQQVSSELNSAQGQLASLTPPNPPSGDDPEAQAAYQAELSAYEAQKSALESQINSLQQRLQQLEAEAQQLQAAKSQLSQAQQQAQAEVTMQDAAMQSAQAKMDDIQQRLTEENPELQQAIEEDEELQSLQEESELIQQQQAEKEAEISELEAQIAEAEAAEAQDAEDAEYVPDDEEMGEMAAEGQAAELSGEEEAEESALPAEAYAEGQATTIDDMKERIIAEQAAKGVNISAADIEVISGSGKDDKISVSSAEDGSITVDVNGTKRSFTAEQAERLIIDGAAGDDIIRVSDDVAANMHIMGGRGDDKIYGGSGHDYIVDDYGHNEIHGGDGDDIIKMAGLGKRGPIEALGDLFNHEWELTNTVYGGDGNDTIYGGRAQDTIYGEEGDDVIYAGAGNDELSGGAGTDIINTGAGADLVSSIAGEDEGKDALSLDAEDSHEVYTISEDAKLMRQRMVEMEGMKDEDIQMALGGDGDDEINVTSGGADGSIVVSVNGRETRYSAEEAKRLIIDSGNGNDRITVDEKVQANLHITGGDGDDAITGGSGQDTIYDNYGGNTIDGGAGDDTVVAHGFDRDGTSVHGNTIIGGAGRDYIETGAGNDTIEGGDGGDVIYAGAGNDTVRGGAGDDFINAGSGDDEVYGEADNDTIFGLAGNDKLYGGDGYDTIASGKGDDTVDGGAGEDIIRYTDSSYGHDQVAADSSDDARALDPIEVPSDHFVVGNQVYHSEKDTDGKSHQVAADMTDMQAQMFADFINDNLEAFASIDPGQALLQGIADTQYKVTFGALNERNGYCQADGGRGWVKNIDAPDANGERKYYVADGSDSIVKINPSFIDLGGGNAFSEQNPMIAMAHEMSHAYNNAKGNMDFAYYDNDTGELTNLAPQTSTEDAWKQRAIRGAELQAVGMYDDSTIAANPYGISENDYRQFFHMAPRTTYMSQNEEQYANSNHGYVGWEDTWH